MLPIFQTPVTHLDWHAFVPNYRTLGSNELFHNVALLSFLLFFWNKMGNIFQSFDNFLINMKIQNIEEQI